MYCDHLEANLQLVSLLLLPVPAQVGHIPLDLSKFVMIMVMMMMMMRIMMKMAMMKSVMTMICQIAMDVTMVTILGNNYIIRG